MGADLSKGKYTKMGGKLNTQTSSDGADMNESGFGGNETLNSSGMSANIDTDNNSSNSDQNSSNAVLSITEQDLKTDNNSRINETTTNSSVGCPEISNNSDIDTSTNLNEQKEQNNVVLGNCETGGVDSTKGGADSKSNHFGKLKDGIKSDIMGKFSKYETLPTKEESIDE